MIGRRQFIALLGGAAARPVEAGDEPNFDRVVGGEEDDWDRSGRRFGWLRGRAICCHHGDLTADQIGCQCRQSIIMTLRPAIFDGDVAAFDIAGFAQSLVERVQMARVLTGRFAVEEPSPASPAAAHAPRAAT